MDSRLRSPRIFLVGFLKQGRHTWFPYRCTYDVESHVRCAFEQSRLLAAVLLVGRKSAPGCVFGEPRGLNRYLFPRQAPQQVNLQPKPMLLDLRLRVATGPCP